MVENNDLSKYICYENITATDFKVTKREAVHKRSILQKYEFFDEQAKKVHWHKKYTKVISDD